MPQRVFESIEETGPWDVVVAGGGPSGCAAAAAAAQEGMRVLLLERSGALGGMGTSGMLPAWCPFSDGEKVIHRGLAWRVFESCLASLPHVPRGSTDWVPINTERLKRVYDELLDEAGVNVQFHSQVAGLVRSDRTLESVTIANKAGLTRIRGAVFVDATGDGDVAAWAGAPFEHGDDKGDVQPATLCFSLANVDLHSYFQRGKPSRQSLGCVLDHARYPRFSDLHVSNVQVGPGIIGFNAGHLWNVNGTNPDDLSRAMIEGRRIAEDFRAALAEYFPEAFGSAHLVATAAIPGIRESRRIMGDYLLTLDDYLARRCFHDEIARNAYPIDLHPAASEAANLRREDFDIMARYAKYQPGESHGIPYRCLIPEGIDNLLVTGRSISTDRIVQASTRIMPVALVLGESAGVASSLACMEGGKVRQVDPGQLRARLIQRGAYLPKVQIP
ncbi:MAG TPA: FAD-dependent oxidoreductase [Holophaga sp.]|nr:FAD-dependent oxidoreductase [Holophaga sp.]